MTIAKRTTRCRRRGAAILETVLWMPILFVLFMGTVEVARVTYTYYTLHKILATVARYIGHQQNVNFCQPGDINLEVAKALALSGGQSLYVGGAGEGEGTLVRGLSPSQIGVRIQRLDSGTGSLGDCDCTAGASGCDLSQGARGPDMIVVEITDGFPLQLRIPGVSGEPLLLRPRVQMPYTGT